MPNGYVAKDAVSFGHSWILEEKPCTGGMQALVYVIYWCSCLENVESGQKILNLQTFQGKKRILKEFIKLYIKH